MENSTFSDQELTEEIAMDSGETSQGRDKRVIPFDQEAQTQSGLSREERVKMFKEEIQIRISERSKTPKIQKVIFLLRDHEEFVKYNEPRVVSLGPIHHGKERYQLAETFKRKLANLFVLRSCKTIEEICEAIDGRIKELRECFEKEVTKIYNDVDLAWILVIDGCAILQYIHLAINNKFKAFGIKNDSVAFCQQDLFLLENQVPYLLLELLMNSSIEPVGDGLRNSVKEFIKRNHHMVLMDKSWNSLSGKQPENPTHLLDLLRSSLLGNAKENEKTEGNLPTKRNPQRSSDWQSCRTVQELKAAGIHVKRSEANSLRNISYSRKLINCLPGVLSLPPLMVDDSTVSKLLNLIAYEMCLDFDNDFGITSYVSFLYSLIEKANDVKELRKAHILFNLLGSNEELAKLFSEIGTDLLPEPDEHQHVKIQIQEYYDNKTMVWVAELYHEIFSRPWKIVVFLGSLSALVLTAIQTWYSPSGPCDDFCKKFTRSL